MTAKQQLFFKELLEGNSGAKAARNAGYSPKSARVSACKNITKHNEFWLSLLVEAGIDIKSLAKHLKQGLDSQSEEVKYKYTKLALELADKILQAKEYNVEPERDINLFKKLHDARMALDREPNNKTNDTYTPITNAALARIKVDEQETDTNIASRWK